LTSRFALVSREMLRISRDKTWQARLRRACHLAAV